MLDVIGEVTFSQRFGLMEIGEEPESLKIIKRAARSTSWVGQVPWVYRIHQILSPIIGNQLALNARNGYIRDFTMQQAQSRLARGSDHRDMLSKLIEVSVKKPAEMDHMVVISMAASNVFAGSDTTAIALRSIFYHLLKNPRCMQRLLKEIDDVTRKMDMDKPVTFEQANNMPYLQAVMNEALRIHPIIGQSLPRVVPEGGLQIEGHLIPKGVSRRQPFLRHTTDCDRQLSALVLMSLVAQSTYMAGMLRCFDLSDGWKMKRMSCVSRCLYNALLVHNLHYQYIQCGAF